MIEITYQIVLSTLQTIALIVGIAYYLIIMRNAQKTRELSLESQELTRTAQEQALETRQAQLFMQMYNRWRDSIGNDDFGSVISRKISNWKELKSILHSDENYQRIFNELAGFYEGLGVLVKAGYLSIHPIALMWTGVSTLFWTNILEPTIDEWRTEQNLPRLWSEAEYLCRELMQYIEEHPELRA